MPTAPSLTTSITPGSTTGHVNDHITIAGVVNNIYLTPVALTKTSAYTLTQGDSGEVITVDSASSVPITVPTLVAGTSIELLRYGTGAVTLITSGVTLVLPTGATATPRAQGSTISLLWRTTSEVIVGGDLTYSASLTKADVGLANVDNTSDVNKPVSTAQAAAIAALTKTSVGLANVDNTSDVNKPVSTAQAAAIAASTVASTGITSTQKTASFTLGLTDVTKVLEYDSTAAGNITLPAYPGVLWPPDAFVEVSQVNTGQATFVGGAGVVVRTPPSPAGAKTRGQWSGATARRRATYMTPPSTNLIARWRADDLVGADNSAVSSWAESSGAGLPAATQATTANQPKLRTGVNGLNGHNVVQFNATSTFLVLSGTALNLARNRSAIILMVAYRLPATLTTTTAHCVFGLSNGLVSTTHRAAMYTAAGAGNYFPATTGRRLDADSFAGATGTVALVAGSVGILTSIWRWNTSDAYMIRNGALIQASNTAFQTDGVTSDTASLAGAIGSRSDGGAEWFEGDIAEVLIYNTGDTVGDLRPQVSTYFQNTYGPNATDRLNDEWVITGDTTV